MKFSQSIVLAALLGSLTYSEVNAVAIKQSEAQQLMASIDLEMETIQKKHKKHHKKHHKKSKVNVQTHDDAEGPEPSKEEKAAAAEGAKKAMADANKAAAEKTAEEPPAKEKTAPAKTKKEKTAEEAAVAEKVA